QPTESIYRRFCAIVFHPHNLPLARHLSLYIFFSFTTPPTPGIYTLSLHDALPIWALVAVECGNSPHAVGLSIASGMHEPFISNRSEEHTSELQSLRHLVCRLLLEKKKNKL